MLYLLQTFGWFASTSYTAESAGDVPAEKSGDDKPTEPATVPSPPDAPPTHPQKEPPGDKPAPVKRAPDAPKPDDPKHV